MREKHKDVKNSLKKGNENGGKLPRDWTPKRFAGMITIILSIVLVMAMVGNSGVVRAEQ